MRWLFRIGIALVVLLVVPILGVSFFLDSAVSRAASSALGVDTRLQVLLRPVSGRVSILHLSVANPPGFESRQLLRLRRGRFDVRVDSLREDRVVSPLLRLEGVELSLERRGGRYNYQAILDHLGRVESGAAAGAAPPEDAAGGRQFVIQNLEIRDVVADVDVSELLPDRARIHVEVPEIHLTGVGGSEGVSMAQLSGIVLKAILGAVARRGVGLPAELAGALRVDLGALESVAIQTGPEAARKLRDAAGEGTGRVLRGLGGVLDRGGEK